MQIANRFLFVLLLAPPILLAGAVFWMSQQLLEESDRVAQSTDLMRTAELTLSALKDAEIGQRGYVLTGEEEFLEPYEQALRELPVQEERLEILTANSEIQRPSVDRIQQLIDAKMDDLRLTIELHDQGRFEEALGVVREGAGKRIMDELRAEIDRIDDAAISSLLENRRAQNNLGSIFVIVAGASLVLTGIGLLALYRVGAAQEAARAEAKAATLLETNQQLEDFARVAAHDLRSPTRTAVSLLQMGKRKLDGRGTPEAEQMFDRVEKALRRQLKLIDDLLNYQQMGNVELPPPTQVDLDQIVGEACENLGLVIAEASATIHRTPLPKVQGHATQLVQLFQNLVENAIKYRDPQRPLVIQISCKKQQDKWIIRVQDNGLGFAAEYAERIFRPFARIHSGSQAGSGIGLASCRRIAEGCGGTIWAESEEGVGSTFLIALPANESRPV